jgi:hypothetical protein
MSRAGWMGVELAIALSGLLVLGLLAVDAARAHRLAQTAEERAAALEVAQDLLARLRRGDGRGAEPGWEIERSEQSGAVLLTVLGHGVRLSTVVPR